RAGLLPLCYHSAAHHRRSHSFPTRRSSDLRASSASRGGSSRSPNGNTSARNRKASGFESMLAKTSLKAFCMRASASCTAHSSSRSEEHTSELQSRENLVCRLLLEKKKMCQF